MTDKKVNNLNGFIAEEVQTLKILDDPIAEMLDELSDLALIWDKYRQLNCMPSAIRVGMLSAISNIQTVIDGLVTDVNNDRETQ